MSFYKRALKYPIILILIGLQIIAVTLALSIPMENIEIKLYDTYIISSWEYMSIRTLITSVLLFIAFLAVRRK